MTVCREANAIAEVDEWNKSFPRFDPTAAILAALRCRLEAGVTARAAAILAAPRAGWKPAFRLATNVKLVAGNNPAEDEGSYSFCLSPQSKGEAEASPLSELAQL
jgi:hypothetical protein